MICSSAERHTSWTPFWDAVFMGIFSTRCSRNSGVSFRYEFEHVSDVFVNYRLSRIICVLIISFLVALPT